ncbi:AciT family ciprofloxacin tolerance protein [Psychrobacter lutiphocae]|uniref:AciT family ciprofloxacin tolerance protein n=1 Tax=Psychrobacter lutiphocae TaxID=540500 RepID=UPI000364FE3E|nr:AciT family ciprofloxacin tolerance protein [Psychrobacter lutiphocae]
MAILTIMATSHTGSTSAFTWSTLGFVLLTIGLIATFFSDRRYLLGYLFAGMSYWIVIEGIQSILINITALSKGYSYVAALLITWVTLAAFIGYRYKQYAKQNRATVKRGVEPLPPRRQVVHKVNTAAHKPVFMRNSAKVRKQQDKYIEHTPIYNNYKPRFRN